MREYYDLWASLQRTARAATGAARNAYDARSFTRPIAICSRATSRRLFVQSRTIQQRLAIWPELRSTVLYPPAPQRPYRCDGYGDYVFMVSRLTPLKRADLLIEALAQPEAAGIRAVIAGEGEERSACERLVARLGRRRPRDVRRAADRRRAARSSGALPRGVLSAVRGGLRVRHRRSVCVAQGGRHVPRQRRARRSWSRTA